MKCTLLLHNWHFHSRNVGVISHAATFQEFHVIIIFSFSIHLLLDPDSITGVYNLFWVLQFPLNLPLFHVIWNSHLHSLPCILAVMNWQHACVCEDCYLRLILTWLGMEVNTGIAYKSSWQFLFDIENSWTQIPLWNLFLDYIIWLLLPVKPHKINAPSWNWKLKSYCENKLELWKDSLVIDMTIKEDVWDKMRCVWVVYLKVALQASSQNGSLKHSQCLLPIRVCGRPFWHWWWPFFCLCLYLNIFLSHMRHSTDLGGPLYNSHSWEIVLTIGM